MGDLIAKKYKTFEDIKHKDDSCAEFWLARELAAVLGYARWENFSKVIGRAMLACKNSGHDVFDQFRDVTKLVEHGSGATRKIADYRLSRYACYLIVQNGDPRKEVIALGQTYIAQANGIMPENQPTPVLGITEIEKQQIQALKNKKKMLDE